MMGSQAEPSVAWCLNERSEAQAIAKRSQALRCLKELKVHQVKVEFLKKAASCLTWT